VSLNLSEKQARMVTTAHFIAVATIIACSLADSSNARAEDELGDDDRRYDSSEEE